jgi:hypothetical protein
MTLCGFKPRQTVSALRLWKFLPFKPEKVDRLAEALCLCTEET